MRLVCSTLSTVLGMLRPLIVAWPSPVQLMIMNGRKLARVASSPISICWWLPYPRIFWLVPIVVIGLPIPAPYTDIASVCSVGILLNNVALKVHSPVDLREYPGDLRDWNARGYRRIPQASSFTCRELLQKLKRLQTF